MKLLDLLVLWPPFGEEVVDELFTIASCVALDVEMEPEEGVVYWFKLWSLSEAIEGYVHSSKPFTAESDENGSFSVQLWKGAVYLGRREEGPWLKFRASTEATSTLPSFVGKRVIQ